MHKLSDLLSTECPSVWELGKLDSNCLAKCLNTQTKETKSSVCLNETLYSVQSLASLVAVCQFCDGFLLDQVDKENQFRFCSEYCRNSYAKLSKIRKMSSFKSIQFDSDENLKLKKRL